MRVDRQGSCRARGGIQRNTRVSYRINELTYSCNDVSLVTNARVTSVKLQVPNFDF